MFVLMEAVMGIDPHLVPLLNGPAPETLTVEQARAAVSGMTAFQGRPAPAELRDIAVPGDGGPIPVRLCRPENLTGTAPALVWMHGGGWIRGTLDAWNAPLSVLAERTGTVVASVDYRLAPETPFPGALDDVRAVVAHLAANAGEYGIDAARLALGGDSAGGHLAATAALAIRDLGGPGLAAQVLLYPPIDPAQATSTQLRFATGYGLTSAAVRNTWNHYLPTPYAADHPYASPLRARDLSGLPPAIVATAEYDVLRDEGERYAEALAAAGTPVDLRRFAGMTHGFLHYGGIAPASLELFDWLAARLHPLLGR